MSKSKAALLFIFFIYQILVFILVFIKESQLVVLLNIFPGV